MLKNRITLKLVRAVILFFSLYFVTKYFTTGKMPYKEIIMISATAVLVQTLLDIYGPLLIIKEKLSDDHEHTP
jgi:hypothetical protein